MRQKIGLLILNYLRFFAHLKLAQNHPIVIGVTGSAGKTSCRKAIVQILATKGQVKESIHANSESGISLNILNLTPTDYSPLDWLRMCALAPFRLLSRESYAYYVAEMEADSAKSPKNMDYLLSIISPDIGVYVSSGVVHSDGFDHLVTDHHPARRSLKLEAAIVRENGKLLTHLSTSGVAVYYYDNAIIRQLVRSSRARQLGVGTSRKASLQLVETIINKSGFAAKYRYQGQVYTLNLPILLEKNYALTFGLALGVGASLGVSVAHGVEALSSAQNLGRIIPPGRMRIFDGIKGSTLIDSSYNSSPKTVSAALELLRHIAGRSKAVAVLGDLRELGTISKSAHRKLADEIMQHCDICYLFGNETKAYTLPRLVTAKFPVFHFDTIKELNAHLTKNLPAKSWVIIKGSQNTILLERVVEVLLADKKDANRLCRRGKYWDRIRSNTK
ncbi:MAG: Mur ligase family protein [bacterium]